MKGLKRSTSSIFLLLFVTIFFSPLPALSTTLSIQPAVSTPTVGSSFDVFVNISSVTDLYAFQFDIVFNTAILSAINIKEGSFLPSGGDTFPFSTENTDGSITFVDTLLTSISGVNGDGPLVDVTFQALASGTSPIDISNVILLNSSEPPNNDISFTTQSGSVTVASAVPEPSTILLISMGMAALGIVRKKWPEII